MSKAVELTEVTKYIQAFGVRYKIAREEWVKLILINLMRRRSELLATLN